MTRVDAVRKLGALIRACDVCGEVFPVQLDAIYTVVEPSATFRWAGQYMCGMRCAITAASSAKTSPAQTIFLVDVNTMTKRMLAERDSTGMRFHADGLARYQENQ